MIIVIDFGSQTTDLIVRRVQEMNVFCYSIAFGAVTLEELKGNKKNPVEGIILSGSADSTFSSVKGDFSWLDPEKLKIPVLGICYGMHVIVNYFKGKIASKDHSEFGKVSLKVNKLGDLFNGMGSVAEMTTWMSHNDTIEKMPEGFEALAFSGSVPCAIANEADKRYGLQFHPEVTHTEHGELILKNFVMRICGCKGSWRTNTSAYMKMNTWKSRLGDEKVLCALSGGVDSSVVAVLLHKAIGDNLTCVFIDNGLMRKGEPEEIVETFGEYYGIKLIYVDAKKTFLSALKGVIDPEEKRKVIGGLFIKEFEEEAKKLGNIKYLAQGTIASDVIESSGQGKRSKKIKSHHNVGGLPEHMNMKLVEPLKDLFKDQVRDIGKDLNIPHSIIHRQPFPGPGLSIRIIGEVTEEKLKILREADSIIHKEIKKAGLYYSIWQSFAVLLPIKSVVVMGDGRTYESVIVLRSVNSKDAMTAEWTKLPFSLIESISSRIVNEVQGVNRVVYDVTSKPPSTIEWE